MGDMVNKFKYFIGIDGYEEENEDDFLEEDQSKGISPVKSKKVRDNVVNLHTNATMKIIVHEPLTYEEAPKIVDDLKSKKAVVINFEQLDANLKRQIFDFINGSIYSIEGKIQKVTKDIFILAPKNVEIDGIKDELKNKGIFPW